MAQFIHLFDEKQAASLKRSGIRLSKSNGHRKPGIFVTPIVENHLTCHQWMRELRRRTGCILLAARIRIDDDERVLLGEFNEEHIEVSASQAIGILRKHEDPMGLEVIVPRTIRPTEIESIYRPPKVVGWRYYPKAHGRKPCPCAYCQRGEPFRKTLQNTNTRT